MKCRNILVLGCTFLSSQIVLCSPQADAFPDFPLGVSSTSFPYENFMGTITGGQTVSILTVPSDKIFVFTGGRLTNQHIDVLEDGAVVLNGETNLGEPGFTILTTGNLHLSIAQGRTLQLHLDSTTTANYPYYIEGYYASSTDFPFEDFSGTISGSQPVDILTVPNDRIFVITGAKTHGGSLDIIEDGATLLDGDAINMSEQGQILTLGKAHLKISSGATLSILPNHSSYTVHYYIEGYYAIP